MLPENSYGFTKRLEFIKDVVKQLKPNLVLDFGCGTGNNLLVPLAEYFPDIKFVGVDIDVPSVEFARRSNTLSNLIFTYPNELETYPKFNLIIASEVIEHVEEPEKFLLFLKDKLRDGGQVIVTLPNGYGSFEIMSLIEVMLYLSGLYALLRKIKRTLSRSSITQPIEQRVDTLAVSPHINFFSYDEVKQLFDNTGLQILQYCPRTWLCGFVFDQLMRGKSLLWWNAKIADYLPPFCNSGWMFVLDKEECVNSGKYQYRQGY